MTAFRRVVNGWMRCVLPVQALLVSAVSTCAVWAVETTPDAALPEAPAGITYEHRRAGDVPWAIYVVKVDRSRADFDFATSLGQGRICGLATVRGQVAGLASAFGRPVAAVNGDFFVIRAGPYQGDPAGLHIVEGELVSASRGSAFWVDVHGRPRIGEVYTRIRVTGPAGLDIRVGLNQQCVEDQGVLFTPAFGASTRTSGGRDLVLEAVDDVWVPLRLGQTYRGRIVQVREGGNAALGASGMVVSLGAELAATVPGLAEGTVVQIEVSSSPNLAGVRTAVGGGVILMQDGKAGSWEGNLPRHPRTAVGFNAEHVFLVVVDGRREGHSAGMTYTELASLMAELGCTAAVNLDGGGSSTLWLAGCVMNRPSDGRERAVANSLIVVDRGGKD